jgi:type 1 fimbria pilin
MIKKCFAALSATALIGVAPYAMAASSTDLTVTGIITPAACTPTLSGRGIVDHGKLSAKDLNRDKPTFLPLETVLLAVNCDAATAFRLSPTDNKLGTVTGPNDFGLGYINGDQKLGGFTARLMAPIADGVAVQPLYSSNHGDTWSRYADLNHGTLSAFGAVGGPNTPIAVKDLLTDLRVSTAIARADSLDLTNDAAIDGSVTITIDYP